MWCSTSCSRFRGRRRLPGHSFQSCTPYRVSEASIASLQAVADLVQAGFSATVIEVAARRSGGADRADDLVVELDDRAAGEEQHMRQFGEQNERTVAFGAVGQSRRIVLECHGGVSLIVRAIEGVDAGNVAARCRYRRSIGVADH